MVKEQLGVDEISEAPLTALAQVLEGSTQLEDLRQRLTPELEQRQARIDDLEDNVSALQNHDDEDTSIVPSLRPSAITWPMRTGGCVDD